MKTHSVLFAEDAPHYGFAHITAASAAEALEAARHLNTGHHCTDPDLSSAVCRRIVHIEAEEGTIAAKNIALDGFFLRHVRNIDPLLCDAAPCSGDCDSSGVVTVDEILTIRWIGTLLIC